MTLPKILDHSGHVLVPFALAGAGGLPDCRGLAGHLRAAGTEVPSQLVPRCDERPVWTPRPLPLSRDLLPHVTDILGAAAEGGAVTLAMTDAARDLLLDFGGPVRGLKVALSGSARERLQARLGREYDAGLVAAVAGIDLACFNTGVAVAVVRFEVAEADGTAAPAEAVLEGLAALCHAGASGRNDLLVRFLGAALAGARQLNGTSGRLFSYMALRLDRPLADEDARRELAVRLARRYTDGYRVRPDMAGFEIQRPFDGVTHGFSLEGGATIVEAGADAPDFLVNFIANSVRSAYLPVALVAYHQYLALLEMSRRSMVSLTTHGERREAELARLQGLKHALLRYRVGHRVTLVSQVTMHNQVYDAWGRVLMLDRLQDEVSKDVAEADRYLASHSRDWLATIGSFLLGFLTAHTFVETAGKAVFETMGLHGHLPPVALLALSTLGGVAMAWQAWHHGHPPAAEDEGGAHGHKGHVQEHAEHDFVLHKNRHH